MKRITIPRVITVLVLALILVLLASRVSAQPFWSPVSPIPVPTSLPILPKPASLPAQPVAARSSWAHLSRPQAWPMGERDALGCQAFTDGSNICLQEDHHGS